jgi:4-amino-4-deoxy-L-arabinose transferase-like glycosyltransferase
VRPTVKTILDSAFPCAFVVFVLYAAPMASGFQFGSDEGYELMKALLVSRGYALYGDIWNDQPPLHTLVLATMFRWLGPEALWGRLLSLGCAAVLLDSFYSLVKHSSGRPAALLSSVFLAFSSFFAQLSISAML